MDEWRDRDNLKGIPEPRTPELWWEGSSPSIAHIRKQKFVNWIYKMMSRAVKLRNRLNYLYWTQLCPRLPLNNVQFEQFTDFKFPQRMYLATMASFVMLMVLQLAIAAQFNHVGSMIELSRPLLTTEVAHVRLLPANTVQWSIGRPNSKNGPDVEANIDQFSEIVPFSQWCERSTPHVRSIADEAEDIGSRLTFSCLLRQFSIRVFSRDDGV